MTGRAVDQVLADRLQRLLGEPDDRAQLAGLTEHIGALDDYLDAVRTARDDCAVRLRLAGVPMVEIAAIARVGDSYLSRRAIARGLPRRTDRTRRAGAVGA